MEKLLKNESHFKSIVKVITQSRMRDLATFIFEQDKLSSLGEEVNRESIGAKTLECVSGVPHDGWWPFQDGGFEVSEFFVNGWYTNTYFVKEEEEFNEFLRVRAWKDFLAENDKPSLTAYHELSIEKQEEFDGIEDAYFEEEVLLRVVISIRDGGISLSKRINYLDAPYYRHSNDLILNEKNLSEKEFLKLSNEQLWELIK